MQVLCLGLFYALGMLGGFLYAHYCAEDSQLVLSEYLTGYCALYEADLRGPSAIVIGSEGEGMSRLVAGHCDFTVSIPMKGKLNSLNASASAAILLYEAVRQRR